MNKINSSFFKKLGNFLRSSYIFIVLAIIYIPLIMVVLISFNPQTDKGNINLNFGILNGINYLKLFENNTFINALLNTLLLSVLVTPVSVLIGIMACYGIWKSKSTTKNFVLGTARLSMLNPDAITGISLLLLFSSTWIPMGLNLGFFTVLLAHISFCTPYAIITIYPRMAKMKQNLVLASYDLGESKIHTFIKVIIPYLMPSIAVGVAFFILFSGEKLNLYNTYTLLIIVGTIKYIPFASRNALNSMLQLSGEIEEAAIIQDIPWTKRMTRIIIPIQKSSIISGFLLPFMTCLRELSLFMLLCTQGFILSTTLDYFDEMGLYAFSSGINLILIITILVFNALVNKMTGASLDDGIGG